VRHKLISLRDKKTLTEIAKELGITRQMLGAIESGVRTPSLDLAKKISDYFGYTIDEIFFK
jgi:putative transcriptional regulator